MVQPQNEQPFDYQVDPLATLGGGICKKFTALYHVTCNFELVSNLIK